MVSKRFIELSRYTSTPCGRANGQTPPIACPVCCRASSGLNIFGLMLKRSLNLRLSSFTSPAVTIIIAPPAADLREMLFAILAGITPRAAAASSTVAVESSRSMISLSLFQRLKYARTCSIDMNPIYKGIIPRDKCYRCVACNTANRA